MADQDAQDINQMMSASSDVLVSAPKKSKFLWIVLGCVVVGVGLGVVVYQQSIKAPVKPSPTPAGVVSTPKPTVTPLASPIAPEVSLVQPQPKTLAFPKAGKLRVYYEMGSWMSVGLVLKDAAGTHNFTIPAGNPTAQMRIFDTNYNITGPTTISIESFLGTNSSQMSIGWANPVDNKCGFNGFGVVDITPDVTWATGQSKGEPIVSVQCWGDWSPSPTDTSSLDFNDYFLIWSYTPSVTASASPSTAASSSPAASPSPSASVRASAVASPSPSASVRASAVASTVATPTATPTPNASARVSMPDTSGGTPVTGVFEVTVGTVSIGLILLILGLFGLLAL